VPQGPWTPPEVRRSSTPGRPPLPIAPVICLVRRMEATATSQTYNDHKSCGQGIMSSVGALARHFGAPQWSRNREIRRYLSLPSISAWKVSFL